MKKSIGTYRLGGINVKLFARDGYGAEFTFSPDKTSTPEIAVGISDNWNSIMSGLLHEAFEFSMTMTGCRYSQSNDYGNDHSGYVFYFNHPQFSDLCGRVAEFVSAAMPDLAKAQKRNKCTTR